MCVSVFILACDAQQSYTINSMVKESSVVAVQIFDQRKFKRRDQGFLGVVNVRVVDVLDLEQDSHGAFAIMIPSEMHSYLPNRNAYARSQEVERQPCCSRKVDHVSFHECFAADIQSWTVAGRRFNNCIHRHGD